MGESLFKGNKGHGKVVTLTWGSVRVWQHADRGCKAGDEAMERGSSA